jgi:hypothetical protein
LVYVTDDGLKVPKKLLSIAGTVLFNIVEALTLNDSPEATGLAANDSPILEILLDLDALIMSAIFLSAGLISLKDNLMPYDASSGLYDNDCININSS